MTLIKTINSGSLFHDLKAMDHTNFTYDGAYALQAYLNAGL